MNMLPFPCPDHSFLTQTLQNYVTEGLPLSTEILNLACGVLTLLITSYLRGTASSAELRELPIAFPVFSLRQ